MKKKAVAINDLPVKKRITYEDAMGAFKQGFEKGLDIQLKPLSLTEEQEQYVNHLVEIRYSTNEWNYLK